MVPIVVPTHFKYFSPQQRKHPNAYSRYPYHRNRAISRRHLPSMTAVSSNEDVRAYLDLNSPTQQQQNVYHYHHRTPQRHRQRNSAMSLLKDLDFIDCTEDDPMLKDSNQFRVTKHQYSSCDRSSGGSNASSDRSPLKKKQRYSNIYDYSFNLSLNSIHEDSTSDDSL